VPDYAPPRTGVAAPLAKLPLSLTKHARTSAICSGMADWGGSALGHAARVAEVSTMLGIVALAGVRIWALRP
jgi:hypothetical protein